MPFLDELETYLKLHIVPGVVDGVFKNSPFLAYLKLNKPEVYDGGRGIQENFLYAPMKATAVAKGATFDITRRQTATGAKFQPKIYVAPVTEYKEDLQIFHKGPQSVFSLLDADMQNAALTMSAKLAIDIYKEGQTAARDLALNGLAEILNDGTANSYDGATYATYGGITRGGTVGTALNSVPVNVNGTITYNILEEKYGQAVVGPEEPNLIVTTNLGLSFIKEKFQPQFRITELDPNIGFRGIRFNSALIMRDQYCPGAEGVNDADLGNYLVAGGEVVWILNTNYFKFWVTDDPEFAFGFSGFIPAQDNLMVTGKYLFAGNVTNIAPRYSKQLYNVLG